MSIDGKCDDYRPGMTMGSRKKICVYYHKNGSCKKRDRFMCIYWEERVKDKERKEAFLKGW